MSYTVNFEIDASCWESDQLYLVSLKINYGPFCFNFNFSTEIDRSCNNFTRETLQQLINGVDCYFNGVKIMNSIVTFEASTNSSDTTGSAYFEIPHIYMKAGFQQLYDDLIRHNII